MPHRPSDIYRLNTHELPRRAGEMKEYELDLVIPERVGLPLIAVPVGDVIEVDAKLESVTEGVLLSADIYTVALGECIRCLDTVEVVVDRKIQELYRYEPTNDKGQRRKKSGDSDDDLDSDDELQMEGEFMDLELPIIDAIILSLPVNPLCNEDCLGLCPDCGEKWESLPEDHRHEVIDARWAALGQIASEDFGKEEK